MRVFAFENPEDWGLIACDDYIARNPFCNSGNIPEKQEEERNNSWEDTQTQELRLSPSDIKKFTTS